MTNLYSLAAIRKLEELAFATLSPFELMQRAGQAAFSLLNQQWPQAKSISVLCGGGNNGGDGYVLARLAQVAGLKVKVWQLGEAGKLPEPAKSAHQACLAAGVVIQPFSMQAEISADILVDALLGIGMKGKLRDDYSTAIAKLNACHKPVLALDLPSGLDADTGVASSPTVKASLTLCFIGLKLGLLTGQGVDYAGQIICHDLELPKGLFRKVTPTCKVLDLELCQSLLPKRSRNSHKGDFGRVLVIGGNYGMAGAARLAGEAAARVGAGLVTIATRKEHLTAINTARPELLAYGIDHGAQLEPLLAKANVIAIGPGLGLDAWAKDLWQVVTKTNKPLIIDADGLNLLAQQPMADRNWILTPHPGEAGRLLASSAQAVQADRFRALQQLSQAYGGVVVLKGAGSLIAGAQNSYLCRAGNPGMASAGMGDLLTGMLAGLVAQGLNLVDASCLGVLLHALAGDRVAAKQGERGMLALDLINELPGLIRVC